MGVPPEVYAFPWVSPELAEMSPGMTLRDWFAGQALVGMTGSQAVIVAVRDNPAGLMSKAAYEYADAMLAERAKGGGE